MYVISMAASVQLSSPRFANLQKLWATRKKFYPARPTLYFCWRTAIEKVREKGDPLQTMKQDRSDKFLVTYKTLRPKLARWKALGWIDEIWLLSNNLR